MKRYGVLFTCLASRAVHLESTNTMDADSFINSLRRFISRRGPVKEIRCDNGSNIVGAERELREAIKELDHDQITLKCLFLQIKWVFNPPAASHMGGNMGATDTFYTQSFVLSIPRPWYMSG